MSRIGRMPVPIPKGVEVFAEGDVVRVKGPRGELANRIPPGLTVTIEETQVRIARSSDEPRDRAFHGLMRSLVANAVQGVTKGFSRDLEIVGVGYKAEVRGKPSLWTPRRGSSRSPARTARRSDRPPRRFASCACPTRTRPRGSSTPTK